MYEQNLFVLQDNTICAKFVYKAVKVFAELFLKSDPFLLTNSLTNQNLKLQFKHIRQKAAKGFFDVVALI